MLAAVLVALWWTGLFAARVDLFVPESATHGTWRTATVSVHNQGPLAVQAGIFLATIWTILFARGAPGRPRPVWSSLAVSLTIVAATSWNIAEDHRGQPGADLLAYDAPLLLGMGIICALMLIRRRRGLDEAG